MRNRPIAIIAGIIVIALIAFALIGLVREYIAPWILKTIWRMYVMADSVPQVMIWAIFVAAIPVLAIFVLIQSRAKEMDDSAGSEEPPTGQVRHWVKQIQRSSSGDYFKRSFIRQLMQLTYAALEYRERMTEEEIQEALEADYFAAGSEISSYLAQGQRGRYSPTKKRSPISRLFETSRSKIADPKHEPWQDSRLIRLIELLEKELEV